MNGTELATRDRILEAARREFLEKGYKGAWLRDIAKKAGVTTGALYGYFKNKEELFGALVREAYEGIQDIYARTLEGFAALPAEQQQADMEDIAIQATLRMTNYMYSHRDAFKLILCCSQDTEYADLTERMARLDEQATSRFAQTTAAAGMPFQRTTPRLEHILTTGLFTMFFELIVHDVPREEADDYVVSLIHFYTAGCSRIMGFEPGKTQ